MSGPALMRRGAGTTRSFTPVRRWLFQLALLGVCIIWAYPLVWALSSSLKTNKALYGGSTSILPADFRWSYLLPGNWDKLSQVLHFGNYATAWFLAGFSSNFVNSVVVTVGAVVIVLVVSCLSGYALGRYSFPGKYVYIGAIAATVFIPHGYTIIPIWKLIHLLGLADSRFGVIVAVSSGGHLLYILLFMAYFAGLPKELEESATLDGAGFFRTFWSIMLPMAKPMLATVTILEFVRAWNEFFLPLVFTANNSKLQTLAVGIYTNFTGDVTSDIASSAAGMVITFVPVVIVFLALQKYFVEGVAGAMKG